MIYLALTFGFRVLQTPQWLDLSRLSMRFSMPQTNSTLRLLGPVSLYSITLRRWELWAPDTTCPRPEPPPTFPSWCPASFPIQNIHFPSCFLIFWRKFLQSPNLLRERKDLEDQAQRTPSFYLMWNLQQIAKLPPPQRRTEGICISRGRWTNGLMCSGAMVPKSVIQPE